MYLTQSVKLHDDFVGSEKSERKLSALNDGFLQVHEKHTITEN